MNKLTPEQADILLNKGTEPPHSGALLHNKKDGMYHCAACNNPLFSSNAKFDSGSGWPSFTDPVAKENIELKDDTSHGMQRTEVTCKQCGGHLGHVFPDGPGESGQRYCINSLALGFNEHNQE